MDCGWPEFLSDVFSPHCFSVPFLNSQERKKKNLIFPLGAAHPLSQSNNMYLGQWHWTIQCGGQDCTNLRQFKNRILNSCPPQINGIKHAGRKTTIAEKVNISWGCTDLRCLWCFDPRNGSRRPLGKEVKDWQDVGEWTRKSQTQEGSFRVWRNWEPLSFHGGQGLTIFHQTKASSQNEGTRHVRAHRWAM